MKQVNIAHRIVSYRNELRATTRMRGSAMRSVRSHVRAYIARIITPIILKILLSNKSYLLFYSSTKLM